MAGRQSGLKSLIVFFFLVAMCADAFLLGVMYPLSTRRLAGDSSAAVRGEVVDLHSHWDDARNIIFTRAKILVFETVKGDIAGQLIDVEFPGGEVGEFGMGASDQPKLALGERVFLFLRPTVSLNSRLGSCYEIVGAGQGKYSIGKDGIARKGGFSVVEPDPADFSPTGRNSGKGLAEARPITVDPDRIIDNHIPVQVLVKKVRGEDTGDIQWRSDPQAPELSGTTSGGGLSKAQYSSHGAWTIPGVVRLKINAANSPAYGLGAVLSGMYEWNNVYTSLFKFCHVGGTTSKSVSRNGVNILFFTYLSGNYLGYSNWWTSSGKIIETDVRIDRNGISGYSWNLNRMKAVVMHELGHSLGLNHVSGDAIMRVPISDSRLQLFPDDIRGVSDLYPGVSRVVTRILGSLDAGGKSDIIVRRATDGNIKAFLVDGVASSAVQYLASPGKNWRIVGMDDMDGDGNMDVLSRHTDGRFKGWLMDGLTKTAQSIFTYKAISWKVTGLADLDGDGDKDIVLKHKDGRLFAYLMGNNLTISGSGEIVQKSRDWYIRGFGDLDGLNGEDIVWRNNDGRIFVALMNGLIVADSGEIAAPDTTWSIAGLGDLNGDGKTDIVTRHSDGRLFGYLMDGKTISSSGVIDNSHEGWYVVGIADLNGDGNSDIIARNNRGDIKAFLLNGLTVSSSGIIFYRANSWTICGFGNFDAVNGADIAIRHNDGRIFVYLLNGLTILNSGQIGSPGKNWLVQ